MSISLTCCTGIGRVLPMLVYIHIKIVMLSPIKKNIRIIIFVINLRIGLMHDKSAVEITQQCLVVSRIT